MTTATLQKTAVCPFDWCPSAAELEAIVAEMRPLIAELAADERRRLDRLVASRDKRCATGVTPGTTSGSEHAPVGAVTLPTRNRRRLPMVRSVEAELGQDVLIALLNENSFNPQRRITALRRRLERAANAGRALPPSAHAPASVWCRMKGGSKSCD